MYNFSLTQYPHSIERELVDTVQEFVTVGVEQGSDTHSYTIHLHSDCHLTKLVTVVHSIELGLSLCLCQLCFHGFVYLLPGLSIDVKIF